MEVKIAPASVHIAGLSNEALNTNFFPYLYRPTLSASSASAMEQCSILQALKTCVAYRGSRGKEIDHPDYAPPEVTVQANLAKKFLGVYSVMGNLTHDLFEDLLYDSCAAYPEPLSPELRAARYESLISKFNAIWDTSREFTRHSFLQEWHMRGASQRPTWLSHHALERIYGRCIDSVGDEAYRLKMLNWMEAGASVVRDRLPFLVDESSKLQWKIIEGRELDDGLIVSPKAPTQEEARQVYHQPSFWIDVDGMPLEVYCTIDFGFVRERNGRREMVVADLKTGKIREEKHLKQLALYGVFLTEKNFGFAPDEIVLRLLYPQQDGGTVKESPFSEAKLLDAREHLFNDARRILACYVPLDSPELTRGRLEHSFPKREAELLYSFGEIRRGKPLPTGIDPRSVYRFLSRVLSPIELAEAFSHAVPDVVNPLKKAVERVRAACSPLTHENVNAELVLQLFGQSKEDSRLTDPVAFIRAIKTQRLLVPLSERFTDTAAERWLRQQAGEEVPAGEEPQRQPNCVSCEFSFLCQPGQDAIFEFEKLSGPRRY